MTNESDALAKLHAGLKPDLFRPYVGWVKYFATSGLVQPWDTSLIPNFKHLNPFMVKAGQYNGKQYGIPDDWGFDAILYRTDKVKPKAQLLGPPVRRPLQGQDRLVRRPRACSRSPASTSGSRIRGTSRDAELKQSQKLLIVEEEARPADLVVRDEPLGGVRLGRPLDRVRVAERLGADEEEGAEGRLHAPEGEADRVGRDVHAAEGHAAPELAHAYVNAWSSTKSAKWLEDNYGYGHANTHARPSSSDLLKALQLTNPRAVTLAERVPRPRHPAAGRLREGLGRGEGLLTRPAGVTDAAAGVAGGST